MKKKSVSNAIMATIVTVIMLVLTGPSAFFATIRMILYGTLDDLVFLLPVPIAVAAIYAVWLLVRRHPHKVTEFFLLFGLLLGLMIFYISSVDSCPANQLCLGIGPLMALGVFLLCVFLLSLYYLVRIRLIEKDVTKRTTK